MNWIILLTALFLIIFESVYEGLKMTGKHIISEMVELIYRIIITLVFFAWLINIPTYINLSYIPFWKIIVGYVLLRFAIFDLILNLSAGQKWNYIGNTKLYDRLIGAIPLGFIWFAKIFVALPISLAFLLNYG